VPPGVINATQLPPLSQKSQSRLDHEMMEEGEMDEGEYDEEMEHVVSHG